MKLQSLTPLGELLSHVLGLALVVACHTIEEVWEKDEAQNHKKHHNLDADNEPKRLAHSHTAEAVIVEIEYPFEPVLISAVNGVGRLFHEFEA